MIASAVIDVESGTSGTRYCQSFSGTVIPFNVYFFGRCSLTSRNPKVMMSLKKLSATELTRLLSEYGMSHPLTYNRNSIPNSWFSAITYLMRGLLGLQNG